MLDEDATAGDFLGGVGIEQPFGRLTTASLDYAYINDENGFYGAENNSLLTAELRRRLAPDALGWAYQYWNAEEKNRVFEKVRTERGAKIEGADIIPATQLYTEPYMVKFLVQNSLGAQWLATYRGLPGTSCRGLASTFCCTVAPPVPR